MKNKSNNLSCSHLQRIMSEPFRENYNSIGGDDEDKKDDHGLFILGILEMAVNDKKGRKTVNV